MRMIKCSQCHAEVPAEAAFCDNCGSPLSQAIALSIAARCPACGAEVLSDDAFCDNCGQALNFPPAAPDHAQNLPSSAASVKAWFVEPNSNDTFHLPADRDEFVIGRLDPGSGNFPDIDLVPYGGEEGGVSRRHARICRREGRYFIEDLNSVNYTFLNRQKLPAGALHPIGDGDEMRFGRVLLLFHLD